MKNSKQPSSLTLIKPASPLTLAMTTAVLLAGTQTIQAAPCSVVGEPILVTTNLSGVETSGSFEQAIYLANQDADCNEIIFSESITAINTETILTVDYPVNIVGHGNHLPNISSPGYSVFDVDSSTTNLYVENITVSNAAFGIRMNEGGSTLEVNDVIFDELGTGIHAQYAASISVNNSSFDGSTYQAIYSSPSAYVPSITITDSVFENHTSTAVNLSLNAPGNSLTIQNSVFQTNTTSNTGSASGLHIIANASSSNISITNSVFDNNTFDSTGLGAIQINSGTESSLTLDIQKSSFTNNSGTNGGGLGIYAGTYEADITISQSTFSGNEAAGGTGGGLMLTANNSSSSLTINSSTFFDNNANTSGGGIFIADSVNKPTVTINNTVIANNDATESSNENLTGEVTTLSYSWMGNSTGATFVNAVGNDSIINGTNEANVLLALADNGGFGLTHMPGENSPLVDAGDPDIENAPKKDQNGNKRISGEAIDIGASEFQVPDTETPPPTDPVTEKSSSGSFLWLTPLLALIGIRRRKL